MKRTNLFLSLAFGLATVFGAQAQQTSKPVVKVISPADNIGFYSVSDNGKWAVGHGLDPTSEVLDSYPALAEVATGKVTELWSGNEPYEQTCMTALDVSNGGYVVGAYRGYPAIWNPETKKWTNLPRPTGEFEWGAARSITPDGKFAVGWLATVFTTNGGYKEVPVLWSLEGTPSIIPLTNVPGIDREGAPNSEIRFDHISSNGRYITGQVCFTQPGIGYNFLYDRETSTWKPMAFTYEAGEFKPMSGIVEYTDGATFSPDGTHVTGYASNGSTSSVYVYDIANEKFEVIYYSEGMLAGTIGNDGTVYASEPEGMPIRDWKVYTGDYWYDFKTITEQIWDYNWSTDAVQEEDAMTGTVVAVDETGTVIVACDYAEKPKRTYLITLPQPLKEVTGKINLLARHYETPINNAAFATLKQVTVTFDREIDVLAEAADICLYDEDGNVVRSAISFAVNTGLDNQVVATFRNYNLENGKKYTVVFPKGSISVKGDAARVNEEIKVTYIGREDKAVTPVSIAPEPGIAIERINVTSNPIVIIFDTELSVLENDKKITLQELNGQDWETLKILNGQVDGNKVTIYPVNDVELGKGNKYRVVIPAGTFADLSGASPNEEIILEYDGLYENITPITKYLFFDDFAQGLSSQKWMFYEGDGNNPSDDMYSWDFTADSTPWWFVRDSEQTSDWAACSHSSYSPPGQSYDWMVTKRITIPDDKCILQFKSQSYLKGKEDRLKVYVWATDNNVTMLSESIVDQIFTSADKVYDEIQSPGEQEEVMEGEWAETTIDLKKYAGKNIYIAFLNDNTNQSAVFVDDIFVIHDLCFSASVTVPETVVAQTGVTVKGKVTISETVTEPVDAINIKLYSGEDNLVDEINKTGLSLKADDVYDFEFEKQLPLEVGKITDFKITFKANEDEMEYKGAVTDLAFTTTRRVVLEENTGTACSFCPQGHAMIERLDEMYGDLFIPLAIHGYTGGSQFATGFTSDWAQFLGMSAAPMGVINRTAMGSPLYRNNDEWMYTGASDDLWYDLVAQEFNKPAEADINLDDVVIDDVNDTVGVTAKVKYAYDANNLNVNLLAVLMEDGLYGMQTNGIYAFEADALGEWGNGGKYGTPSALYQFPHVVRSYEGTTYNGTGGYIPSSVVAGKEYTAKINMSLPSNVFDMNNTKVAVLMIDANTGKIINADRKACRIESNSVNGIENDAASVNVVARGSEVVVYAPQTAAVQIYSTDGKVIAAETGNGEISLDLSSHRGIAIVRVVCEGESIVKKVLVK